MKTPILLLLPMLFCGVPAMADTIFDNGAHPPTNFPFSDLGAGQILADDFTLAPGQNTIADVHWSGRYLDGALPADAFQIYLCDDVAGAPGNCAALTLAAVSRTAAGAYFDYTVDVTPLMVPANTVHWLSIFNNTSSWLWGDQVGVGGNSMQTNNFFGTTPTWALASNGAAMDFSLSGPTAVPAPTSFLLSGIGLAALGFGRRKPAPAQASMVASLSGLRMT